MLLQAASNVVYTTQTCFKENCSRQEGEASSLSRNGCTYMGSFKRMKKNHQHAKHCRLSSRAQFAYPQRHLVARMCATYAHGQASCHCIGACFIPTGLHQANFASSHIAMLRLRKTASVSAIKIPSTEGTILQGETSSQNSSTVHKTAMVSAKGVKVEGLEEKTVTTNGNTNAHVSDKDTISSGQIDSVAVGSMKLTEQTEGRIKGLRTWWKAVHEAYRGDTATWGYGSSPIFTVYLGPDSKVEKVLIDEKEIQRRQGVEPLFPDFTNDESKAQAEQKIMLARTIAKDLEMGKRALDRHSTVFAVIKQLGKEENQTSRQKLLSQVDVALHRAAPVMRSAFMIGIPLYGICILCGAYLMVAKRSETDIINEEKSAARLEQMRRLRAQINTHEGSAGTGQLPLAPSEFEKKLLEVREMARQVRSEEGLQKSVKGTDTNVEEYQPKVESLLETPTVLVGDDVRTEQGGMGPEDAIDTTVRELDVPTMDNVDVSRSNNNVIGENVKPTSKVKPRIITSLEEAMAVIGSEQAVSSTAAKLSSDANDTTERVLHEREPQVEQELAGNASKVHHDHPAVTVNSPDGSLNESRRSGTEILPSKVKKIPATSFGEQDHIAKKQNDEGHEGEVSHSNLHPRLDRMDSGTLDELASQGPSRGTAQTLESRLREGSAHLLSRGEENRRLDEIQISSLNRPGAHNGFTYPSDQINGEASPSARSEKFLKKKTVSKSILSVETDDVVGSGQPLRKRETHTTMKTNDVVGRGQPAREGSTFSNTKRWSKELQRKYDLERDPEVRELMKEIGSELDSWVTEEEVEEAARLAERLEEGDEDAIREHYEKAQKKIKEEKEKFGLETVLEKYKEYQPKLEDELWWLDLRCVLCLMVVVSNEEGEGLYSLDMTIDYEGMSNQVARHVIAFEDRKDASNFCRLLELRSGSRFQFAEVCPFSPKRLFEVSKEEGFRVTVLRMGQIQIHVDQSLEEAEDKILEIGRSVYWDKVYRDRSIDIDSILEQRFGL
eukprot:c24453_g1_i2 orf=240-3263(+)